MNILDEFKNINPTLRPEGFYDELVKQIDQVQAGLKEGEGVVPIYSSPDGSTLMVNSIGYRDPDLIVLQCVDAEMRPNTVLVHVNAVQLVLRVVKLDPSTKPNRIGFLGDLAERDKDSQTAQE